MKTKEAVIRFTNAEQRFAAFRLKLTGRTPEPCSLAEGTALQREYRESRAALLAEGQALNAA